MSTTKVANISNLAGTKTIATDDLIDRATCRAWVNFDGTGTVAIRASFNVSSITDNGTGDYTINFTNAMPDANYSASGMAWDNSNNARVVHNMVLGTSSFRIFVRDFSYNVFDSNTILVQVFR